VLTLPSNARAASPRPCLLLAPACCARLALVSSASACVESLAVIRCDRSCGLLMSSRDKARPVAAYRRVSRATFRAGVASAQPKIGEHAGPRRSSPDMQALSFQVAAGSMCARKRSEPTRDSIDTRSTWGLGTVGERARQASAVCWPRRVRDKWHAPAFCPRQVRAAQLAAVCANADSLSEPFA
jgi:hypothetical protein